MALTRKSLNAMGLTEEQVDSIIEMHTETVNGLKKYKDAADELAEVKAQLEQANKDLESAKKDSWKVKYDALKEEFEGYKSQQTQKETRAAKETAYRELLKAAGVSEKRIESVLKVTDLEKVELSDGRIKDADALTKSIREEWADFIVSTTQTGAQTYTPPAQSAQKMTASEIARLGTREERRAAIRANQQNFISKGEVK